MRSFFLNFCSKNLKETRTFFEKIGLSFNDEYCNEDALCLVIEENIYAMIHTPESFAKYTDRQIADSLKSTEAIFCFSVESREAVDKMVDKALVEGGKFHKEPQDHGFMYYRSFTDLDGHIWEVMHLQQQGEC